MQDEPSIDKYITTAGGVVRGQKDAAADTRQGSVYEYIFGAAAILWSRESQRNTDLFAATRFSTADGPELTELIQQRYAITRVLDTAGQGVAQFQRTGTSAGTIFKGTRIFVPSLNGEPQAFYTTSNVAVPLGTKVVTVPIEAAVLGTGTAITSLTGIIDDSLWDSTWRCIGLNCEEGTDFEQAPDYRARVKTERRLSRVGFLDRIIAACEAAGAVHVVAFASNRAPVDYGQNVIYVGDANFSSSTSLLNSCRIALEGVRVLGDNIQLQAMSQSLLPISATVYLVNSPHDYDLVGVTQLINAAFIRYFSSSKGGFEYSRIALLGAVRAVLPHVVQDISFTTPASDVGIISGLGFPSILTRYHTDANNITLTFA